jgi:hypothetical protein
MSVIKTPKKISTVTNIKIVQITNTILFKSPPLVDAEVVIEPVADGDCVDVVFPVSTGRVAVCDVIASPTPVTIVKLEYSAFLKQVGLTSH